MSTHKIGILGTGAYLPEAVLTNFDLEKMVDTSDEWIVQRTGIHQRRIASPEEDAVTMGVIAARRALEASGIEPDQLSYIVLGTNTPAYFYPAGAIRIQEALGLSDKVAGFDVQAGCSGFNYALYVAERLVALEGKYALVVGSDANSRFIDWTNRATCLLFGDGAGAVLIGPSQRNRIRASFIASRCYMRLFCATELNQEVSPFRPRPSHTEKHYLHMEGPDVFKFAVNAVRESIPRILEMAGLELDDLDYLVIHQANYRILEAGARFARVPMEKVFVNIHKYGNLSAASVPVALHEAQAEGKIKDGDRVLLISFGAGTTWGAVLVEWGEKRK